MLGVRVCVRTVTGLGSTTTFSDQSRSSTSSSWSSWAPKPNALLLSSPFRFGNKRRRNNNNNSSQIQIQWKSQSMLIVSRNSSKGRFGGRSGNAHDRNDRDFLEASLLLSGPLSLSLSLSNICSELNLMLKKIRCVFSSIILCALYGRLNIYYIRRLELQ